MPETKNQEEPALPPTKRKPDLSSKAKDDDPIKKLKPELSDNDNSDAGAENEEETDDEEYQSEGDDDGDDDEEYERGEKLNGKAEVDRKGKGIMRDDKGKGKLIEEEDDEDSDSDDDDDDSSGGGSESEGDSDLSDDPLAEVDLDNILPSRTRRKVVRPGVRIANDDESGGGDSHP